MVTSSSNLALAPFPKVVAGASVGQDPRLLWMGYAKMISDKRPLGTQERRPPLDNVHRTVHTPTVRPIRLSIPDARGQGASLRVTRHPEERKIVLSHWRDGLCVATTPVELREVPALIGVLADALGDAINENEKPPTDAPARPSLLSVIQGWIRPRLAQVTELRIVREPNDGGNAG